MNKKGESFLLGILVAVMIFVAGMMLINPIKDIITDTRVTLDCANATGITDGTKLTCLGVDATIPYLIIIVLSLSGGIITSKLAL